MRSEVIIPLNSTWRLLKGTSEASVPADAWREQAFTDNSWLSASAPFYYGENLAGGTVFTDMRNSYTSIFLRKNFVISDAEAIDRLAVRGVIDDGFIIWMNGREVARFNMIEGEISHRGTARGAIEPTWVTNSLAAPSAYLVPGSNDRGADFKRTNGRVKNLT